VIFAMAVTLFEGSTSADLVTTGSSIHPWLCAAIPSGLTDGALGSSQLQLIAPSLLRIK
jgi:hypothetical protein